MWIADLPRLCDDEGYKATGLCEVGLSSGESLYANYPEREQAVATLEMWMWGE